MPKSKINRRRVDKNRWPGVYILESSKKSHRGAKERIYYITYKIERYEIVNGQEKKKIVKIWEKIGTASEGITPQICAERRAEKLRKSRHGDEVKTSKEIALEKQKHDRTLNDINKAYFSSEKGKTLKGKKTDLNRYDLHIKKLLGKHRISSLSPFDIDRIKSSMKGKAPATIANALELLRRLINYGVKNNLCPSPNFVIQLPEKDNEVVEYLDPDQADRFVKILDSWPNQDVARMLKLAMVTGMRRGEIFKLENQDLDFKLDVIKIRDPKGKKSVSIPMNRPTKEILESQIKWRDKNFPESPFIFPGKKGAQRVDCSAVKRIKKKAKLPKEFRIFHGLRHHFGVTLANSGEFSLDMIGELLTHKSIAMTKRYSQFLPGTMKKASERAAELLQDTAQRSKKSEPEDLKAKND